MNTNQSRPLNCANRQPQYSHQKCDQKQSQDEPETEALILSCSEESDFEIFLEEITEITEITEIDPAETSADDLFDWELFVDNYLISEQEELIDESQDLSLRPQFSSTKMEDYSGERAEITEEISDILGEWIDWCYHIERRLEYITDYWPN